MNMHEEKEIWAALNRPELEVEEADIVIFGVPYDGGVSFRSGTKEAPNALRNITYTISPTTEDFESFSHLKIKDLGDARGKNRDEIFENAKLMAKEALDKEKFFIMIGGDHSVTIPVQSAIDESVSDDFGIIHIDAHFDLCDEMGGDKLSHGSTERRALELNNVKSIEDIFFLGIRSIESDELDFYNNNPVKVLSAKEISRIGVEETVKIVKNQMAHLSKIYITLDIDSLDPAYAAGTGTPQFGGLTSRELLNILEGLFKLPIIGIDIVEVSPKLDPSLTSLFAARKIVSEVCGFVSKKL